MTWCVNENRSSFTVPVFIIAMSDMIPNNPLMKIMDASKWNWVQLILSLPVVFLRVGCFSFGLINLLLLGINMFTLIGIGGVAFYLVWLGCFS
jgi:Cu2+-exporting ATPase